MRALSLWQPWAHAVVHLGKRVENRTRWTNCTFRGEFLIHASKGFGVAADFDEACDTIAHAVDFDERWDLFASTKLEVAERRRRPITPDLAPETAPLWVPRATLDRGGIIGVARVDGIIRSRADFAAYAAGVTDGDEQRRWWFGDFALVLADVRPLPFISCAGKQGWFNVPADVAELARAA